MSSAARCRLRRSNSGSARHHRIIGGRGPRWPEAVERQTHDAGVRRPVRQQMGFVIEGEHEELVPFVEQLEEETVDGGAGFLDAHAEHAVTRVQQDAQAHRNTLAHELRDDLRLPVLENLERLALEAVDQASVAVQHGGVHARDIDARSKRPSLSELDILRREHGARQQNAENGLCGAAHVILRAGTGRHQRDDGVAIERQVLPEGLLQHGRRHRVDAGAARQDLGRICRRAGGSTGAAAASRRFCFSDVS